VPSNFGPQKVFPVSTEGYAFNGAITCSSELCVYNSAQTGKIVRLLLGLKISDTDGVLVVFDPVVNIPVKFIRIPDIVSSKKLE